MVGVTLDGAANPGFSAATADQALPNGAAFQDALQSVGTESTGSTTIPKKDTLVAGVTIFGHEIRMPWERAPAPVADTPYTRAVANLNKTMGEAIVWKSGLDGHAGEPHMHAAQHLELFINAASHSLTKFNMHSSAGKLDVGAAIKELQKRNSDLSQTLDWAKGVEDQVKNGGWVYPEVF